MSHQWWLVVSEYCDLESSVSKVFTYFGNERSLKKIFSKKLALGDFNREQIKKTAEKRGDGASPFYSAVFSLSLEGDRIRRPDLEEAIFGLSSNNIPSSIKN